MPNLLRGLKYYTSNICAVVTVADDGGSSGRLRSELGILSPGDIRNCEGVMQQLMDYRFESDGQLDVHSFGNILIAALAGIGGDFYRGVEVAGELLAIRGRVVPSTSSYVTLVGSTVSGETLIGETRVGHSADRLRSLTLIPADPKAHPEAARLAHVQRYLYTSSACVYPSFLQNEPDVTPLREDQAIPADPAKGYGWEKFFAEQLLTYYSEEFGLDIRIVRFHNIYGPLGSYEGGKEKAPAAICRKVTEAEDGTSIEVWGDGEQTRSLCHVDDCIEGLFRLMESSHNTPLNLGTDELVTVNELVDLACKAAGKRLGKDHDLTKPQGVRGRNSDNSLLRNVLGWEPSITLEAGLARTYDWIWSELDRQGRAKSQAPEAASRL